MNPPFTPAPYPAHPNLGGEQATLTDADQRTLHELNTARIPALNARLKTEFDALEVAAAARTRLLSILSGNLQRRREVRVAWMVCEGVGTSIKTKSKVERAPPTRDWMYVHGSLLWSVYCFSDVGRLRDSGRVGVAFKSVI